MLCAVFDIIKSETIEGEISNWKALRPREGGSYMIKDLCKEVLCLLLCLIVVGALHGAMADTVFARYVWKGEKAKTVRQYESDSLCYTIQRLQIKQTTCYVTNVWMKDPGRQVRKGNALWGEHLATPAVLAKRVPEAAIVINGSGYINRTYPEIPDSYPGQSPDYYNTSYGSFVMTDGEILRNLEDVPFYGVVLNADGLSMYAGVSSEDILEPEPISTWSFYDKCALIENYEPIVDTAWDFAQHKATRTILACIDRNNYVVLTATNNSGMRLTTATDYLMETFHPVWAFNLDGGPSSALLAWKKGTQRLGAVFGGEKKDFDILCFCVLTDN